MHIQPWVLEIAFCAFFPVVLGCGFAVIGKERTLIFLLGTFLWTGVIENLFVMIGGYDYSAYTNFRSIDSPAIEGGSDWFLKLPFVPAAIALAWFVITLSALIIARQILREEHGVWARALLAGVFCVSLDMMIDPIAAANGWWRWTHPSIYFHGVPASNYIGWFFLVFFFAAVFERTVIDRKGFRWLRPLEAFVFRADTADLSGLRGGKMWAFFCFRLLAFLPVFLVVLFSLCGVVAILYGNPSGPREGLFGHDVFDLILPDSN